jgi:large subunit ribosomal protein L9
VKVVFIEEVEGSGRIGEVRNVANGYARNYLLPRKLAVPATEHNIRMAEARGQAEAKRQVKLDEEAGGLVERLAGQTITIEVRVGEQGRLYGSVTARDITEALEKPLGLLLEHRQVELEEPIRQVGLFEVPLRLSRNVRASVQVAVLGEGQTLEELLASLATEEAGVEEEEPPEEAGVEEEEPPEEAEVEEEEPPEEAEVEEEEPSEEAEVEEEEPSEEAEAEEEEPSEEAEVGEEETPEETEAQQKKKTARGRRKDKGAES